MKQPTTTSTGLSKFIVYGLVDPRTGMLRYVGKSCSGLKRPRSSCRRSLKGLEGKTYKSQWICGLHNQDLFPSIVVIQECFDKEILGEAERFWIKYFKFQGYQLTNLTEGGDGVPGHVKSPETIKKMREAAYRRWGRKTPIDDNLVVSLYTSGLSIRDVSKKIGTSNSQIFGILKRLGLTLRPQKSDSYVFVPGKGMVTLHESKR